jgi:hypothetical protein
VNLQEIAIKAGFPFGTKYNLGWRTGGGGIDCSGFVSAVARAFGVTTVSATDWTGSLFPKTQAVTNLEPGDLVFFGDPGQVDSHVAIYAGGDQVLDANSSRGTVGTSSLAGITSFYHGQVKYRRIQALTDALSGTTTTALSGGSSGAVSTVDPVLASSAQLVAGQSSGPGGLDASPILGSQALGTVAARVASPGFWWSAGFFILAGLLIVVGLLVVFRQQVEQATVQVGKVAAAAA